jgi:hypothetical protein
MKQNVNSQSTCIYYVKHFPTLKITMHSLSDTSEIFQVTQVYIRQKQATTIRPLILWQNVHYQLEPEAVNFITLFRLVWCGIRVS